MLGQALAGEGYDQDAVGCRNPHAHDRPHQGRNAESGPAEEQEQYDSSLAAIEAGFVRLRPVLMTALAMIIGMAPMSLGLDEGGEQNAPLGRAVIGGLVFATFATLFFVPVVFSIVHRRYGEKPAPRPAFGEAHVTA